MYEMGQIINGTFEWPDALGKDGAKGTFKGPWRLKVPVWENGTYTTSQGVELPGGNRTEDQKFLEQAKEDWIESIEEVEEEDLRKIFKDAPIDADINALFVTFVNEANEALFLIFLSTLSVFQLKSCAIFSPIYDEMS